MAKKKQHPFGLTDGQIKALNDARQLVVVQVTARRFMVVDLSPMSHTTRMFDDGHYRVLCTAATAVVPTSYEECMQYLQRVTPIVEGSAQEG